MRKQVAGQIHSLERVFEPRVDGHVVTIAVGHAVVDRQSVNRRDRIARPGRTLVRGEEWGSGFLQRCGNRIAFFPEDG